MSSNNLHVMSQCGELFLYDAAKDKRDKYFDDDKNEIHAKLNIESLNTVATISGNLVDQVIEIFVNLNEDDSNFERIDLFYDNGLVVWSATSIIINELNKLFKGVKNNLSIKLPLWFSKSYNNNVKSPQNFIKNRTDPYTTYGQNLNCLVIGVSKFSLGVHAVMLNKNERIREFQRNKEVMIDRWIQHHKKFDVNENNDSICFDKESVCLNKSSEVDEVLNNSSVKFNKDFIQPTPTKKITIKCVSPNIFTDMIYSAYDKDGNNVPIKNIRGYHGALKVLSCLGDQNKLETGIEYPYFHTLLPGRVNSSKLDIFFDVEFFTPQEFINVYIFTRDWNVLRTVDKTSSYVF